MTDNSSIDLPPAQTIEGAAQNTVLQTHQQWLAQHETDIGKNADDIRNHERECAERYLDIRTSINEMANMFDKRLRWQAYYGLAGFAIMVLLVFLTEEYGFREGVKRTIGFIIPFIGG